MMRAIVALAAVGLVARSAWPLTANLITAASLVSHLPGVDFRVGTPDDGMQSGAVGPNASGPNTHGAASFALLSQNGMLGTNPETNGYDYILFVDGTLQFTPDYTASSASDLVIAVTGGSLRSTAEFGYPGRGEATTTIGAGTAHLDPATGAATMQLSGTFGAPTGPIGLTNQTLTAAPGAARIVLRSEFDADPTGYIATVLVPLVPANATAIVLVEFTGTVSNPTGCQVCQGFVTLGRLAAYTTDDLGCSDVFPQLCATATTTTTLPGGGCTDLATCRGGLTQALPDPATAQSKKSKKVAVTLHKLATKAGTLLDKAGAATGKKQAKLYKKVRAVLANLLAKAHAAAANGALAGPIAPIEAAVSALLAQLPPA